MKSLLNRLYRQAVPAAIALALSACAVLTPSTPETTTATQEATDPSLPALETPAGLAPLTRELNNKSTAVAPAQPSSDLWDDIRAGFAMPELVDERVDHYIAFYAKRPDYIERMTGRSEKYLYYIVQALQEREMPTELALLPFIESAFNPEALSRAKAAGMWQFIPSTGRHFKLTQNALLDERRDVLESTKAALDYLATLHKMFGDWQLALAAYNWGEGNVQRALKRAQSQGKSGDYLSLRMPKETRDYVPKLMAFRAIVTSPAPYKISLPTVPNHPFFDVVRITQDIDVALAAKFASISEDEFRSLNPSLKHPVILAAGLPRILLPWENAALFTSSLEHNTQALATWTAWRVPKTANPATLAKQVGMSESELRRINGIPRGRVVKQGSVLVVRRTAQLDRDAPDSIANSANLNLDREYSTAAVVRVRPGDTLSRIASRHGVSTKQLAAANGLSLRSVIRVGQKLRIPGRATVSSSDQAAPSGSVRVRPGDSLSVIARRQGVSTQALAQANGLSTRSVIRVGQLLQLPGGSLEASPSATSTAAVTRSNQGTRAKHVRVQRGDSLYAIAKRHGVSIDGLVQANDISRKSTLRVGQRLKLPR